MPDCQNTGVGYDWMNQFTQETQKILDTLKQVTAPTLVGEASSKKLQASLASGLDRSPSDWLVVEDF